MPYEFFQKTHELSVNLRAAEDLFHLSVDFAFAELPLGSQCHRFSHVVDGIGFGEGKEQGPHDDAVCAPQDFAGLVDFSFQGYQQLFIPVDVGDEFGIPVDEPRFQFSPVPPPDHYVLILNVHVCESCIGAPADDEPEI